MRTHRLTVLMIIATALPSLAGAAELQATSSSQLILYNDPLSSDKDQGNVAQYLRLNVTALDKEGKYTVYGYGRIVGQLTTATEARPELIPDANVYGRLYYLFLNARDVIPDHLDLRLGRSYVTGAALPGTLDGLSVNARNLGLPGLGVTAFGGRRVTFDNLTETGNAGDFTAGGSVYVDTVKRTHIEASYGRKWVDSDYAQEFGALDLSTSPFNAVTVTGRLKYDLAASRWAELLAGVNIVPFDPLVIPLVIKGEFVVERPSFDQSSFYSFFNVNRYTEVAAAVEYELFAGLHLNARYAYEDFEDNQHANVVEAGVVLHPVEALTLNVSYLNRNGFGGRLSGLRFHGAYVLGKAALLAGIDYDDFRRELSRSGTAKRYWAGVNYEFNKTFTASVHAEDDLSFVFSHAYQGTLALAANF